MLEFARTRILSRQGSTMRSLDAHDIMCAVGAAAVSGGVRRTAMIALFDYDDNDMLHCKDGDFWKKNNQRWNANNSSVWPDRKLSQAEIANFLLGMVNSERGEPGIFNRKAATSTRPKRRKMARFGTNPCGEIILRPFQFCNLSVAVAREEDSSQLFESIFGMTVSELREDFISNYLVSTKNKRFVQPKGNGRNAIQSYNPKSQITTSTSNFTTNRVIANPSTLFVIFDNESGVGAPNSGILRDQPNVFRIKFKKDITNSENSFYTEEQVNDKIKDLDAQINDLETLIESFPNGVIFPAKLEDNSRKALRENNENIHDHLATLLQEKFNYRINGVKTKEQAEEVAVNEKAVKKPIYINNSKEVPVLIIDLNKNIGKQFAPKSNNIQERIQPKLKNSKERDTFKSNLNTLYDAGFKKVTVVRNNVQYDEVLLPTVIKIKGQLFQLVTIAGSQLGSEFILDTISTPTGSYAEYIAVPEMGRQKSRLCHGTDRRQDRLPAHTRHGLSRHLRVHEMVLRPGSKTGNDHRRARQRRR